MAFPCAAAARGRDGGQPGDGRCRGGLTTSVIDLPEPRSRPTLARSAPVCASVVDPTRRPLCDGAEQGDPQSAWEAMSRRKSRK